MIKSPKMTHNKQIEIKSTDSIINILKTFVIISLE